MQIYKPGVFEVQRGPCDGGPGGAGITAQDRSVGLVGV